MLPWRGGGSAEFSHWSSWPAWPAVLDWSAWTGAPRARLKTFVAPAVVTTERLAAALRRGTQPDLPAPLSSVLERLGLAWGRT